MKVGDIVKAADPKNLKWKCGIIIEEVRGIDGGPFGMQVWKVLVDGKIQQCTDAALRAIAQ